MRAGVGMRGLAREGQVALGVGRRLGDRLALAGNASATLTATTRSAGLDLTLVGGLPGRGRAWVGLGGEVRVDGVGVAEHGEARVAAGVMVLVR